MRVVRWAAGLVVAAWAVLFVVLQLAGRAWPAWFPAVPLMVLLVLVVVTFGVRARTSTAADVRGALGPVVQGLADAQGIQLGRPPQIPVVYGSDEPQATELVVPDRDPFADGAPLHVSRPPSDDDGRPER
jgi:hypothetical protein